MTGHNVPKKDSTFPLPFPAKIRIIRLKQYKKKKNVMNVRHIFLFFIIFSVFYNPGRGGGSYLRPMDPDALAFHAAEPGHLAFGELVDGCRQLGAHLFEG